MMSREPERRLRQVRTQGVVGGRGAAKTLGLAPSTVRFWRRRLAITPDEQVIDYARSRLGHQYDLRNVIDLMRYLLATPPVPTQWRSRMIALGSGDPTRAICSTLIAQAFQSIRYPILPEVSQVPTGECDTCVREMLHIRHHSLFAPRDFDLSPYFEVIKPAIRPGFNHRLLSWANVAGVPSRSLVQ